MKKLHSFALCALITPVLTLGAGSAFAQQPTGQGTDRSEQLNQRDQGPTQTTPGATPGTMNRTQQPGAHPEADRRAMQGQQGQHDRSEHRGYLSSAPAGGVRASDLIGTNLRTNADENVGSVDDLILDQDGQVIALIVGVGGFLGMGQRDVAIGWNEVRKSGTGDDLQLRINATRDDLRGAPEFN